MLPYIYFFLCLCHRVRFPFLPSRKRTRTQMLSPVTAVSNQLLPPAGLCPLVTRLVSVSKTTWRVSWAWGWGCFSGDMGNLFVFPSVTNLDSLFLVCFLISHHFQYSILALPSLDLCPIQPWRSGILKYLNKELIKNNHEPVGVLQNAVAKNHTLAGIWLLL